MKKLYKIALLLLLFITSVSTQAQSLPIRFGVQAGIGLAEPWISEDYAADTKIRVGYQFGVTVDYDVTTNFILQSGLTFAAKGGKVDNLAYRSYLGGKINDTHNFNQLYLQIPIYAAYKYQFTDDFSASLGFGPYFSYGVGGKTKVKLNEGAYGDGTTEKKYDTFKKEDLQRTLKRFDMGLGIRAEAEYHSYLLGFGYELGLLNIADTKNNEFKYKNTNATISVGYKFSL